jgi:PIN domain
MVSMRLRLHVDYTAGVLRDLHDKLWDCRSGNDALDVRDRWLRWWSEADAQLRDLFADGDVAASLYVSQTRVRDVNLDMMPYGILNHEIDVWLDRFAEMVDELVALTPFIERPGLIMVPDTSAFVEGVYFTELNWQELANIDPRKQVRLVVPVLVVEELDELKRGRNHARDRARSVLHRLWELNSDGKRAAVIPGTRPVTVEVLADDSWHVRRPVNDNEIIERALYTSEITGRDVILAAGDFSMLYQASSAGLKTALVDRPDRTPRLERPSDD